MKKLDDLLARIPEMQARAKKVKEQHTGIKTPDVLAATTTSTGTEDRPMTEGDARDKLITIMGVFNAKNVNLKDPAKRDEGLAEIAFLRLELNKYFPGLITPEEMKEASDLTFEYKLARDRAREKNAAPVVEKITLPLWPEAVRAVPNGFLRSALFSAVGKGQRRYINGEDLAAVDGVTIRYKGEQLDQGDLDVWESVLHVVRFQELGGQCRLTTYALLKLMGKTDTGKTRMTLQNRIERLVANAVTIKQGRYTYMGSMIRFAAKDEKTQEWIVEIEEKLRPLFAADQFTQIDWAVRQALNGQPLAQWLHGYYASHAKPYPIKSETLLKLCGSENASLTSGRQKLRKALDAIVEASAANGQPFSYDICNDLIHVQKLTCVTQHRHLTRKTGEAEN